MSNSFIYSSIALTEKFEGLRLDSYQDGAGVWTIGYGHTGKDIIGGMTITEEEAGHLLSSDIAAAADFVNRTVTGQINQNQFDALTDFTFNVGRGHFLASTLLKKVNAGDVKGAVAEFGRWIYAGGEIETGLVNRRAAEAKLFSEDV